MADAKRSTAPESRAAKAAHRRISASAARRSTACEVLLLTSKSFPSQQYQQLLNYIKGLQLPPDVSSLFTTVRNERVAERKALLSSTSQEDVDSVLRVYGSRFALLAQATEDLGLGGTRDINSESFHSLPTLPADAAHLSAFSGPADAPVATELAGGGVSVSLPAPLDVGARAVAGEVRASVSEGVRHESGGFLISMDALPAPAFICDGAGVVQAWNGAISTLTGWDAAQTVGHRLVDVVVPPELRALMQAALIKCAPRMRLRLH